MAKKVLFVLFSSLLISVYECTECVQENQCACRYNDHEIVNFSSLKSLGFLQAVDINDTATYFYHGCVDAVFKPEEHGIPKTVTNNTCTEPLSICLYDKTGNGSLINLGSNKEEHLDSIASGKDAIKLTFMKNNKISVELILACTNFNDTALVIRQPPLNNVHQLILFSPLGCVIEEPRGLSTGSALLIIFFFLVLFYLIFGALLLRFLRGARGMEMIPNLDFWKSLPFLVRDGFIFLLSGCRPTALVTTSEAYDRI